MLKFILPILVLLAGNSIALMLFFSEPETKKRPPKKHVPLVEVTVLEQQNYTLNIRSSGKVKANTETQLVAEVSGKVIKLSDNFKQGSHFNQNEILLQLDDSDYENALTIAKADVEKARLALKEEQARAKLAERDWRLLDRSDQPNELVSREPYIASAKSALAAAEASLEQAKKNLERTFIKAPYAGQVLERHVDIGQFISPGTPLGSIYSKGDLEVHLPISLTQNQYLDLKNNKRPLVEFSMTLGNNTQTWQGEILRSSASIDPNTNQVTLIASIDADPEQSPVKIGQFLRAKIDGIQYQNVYIVPRSAVRQNEEILIALDKQVKIQPIELIHTDGDQMIIKTELPPKSRMILTPMPLAKAGLTIRVKGDDLEKDEEKQVTKPEMPIEK